MFDCVASMHYNAVIRLRRGNAPRVPAVTDHGRTRCARRADHRLDSAQRTREIIHDNTDPDLDLDNVRT